jgi:hypothetical protein
MNKALEKAEELLFKKFSRGMRSGDVPLVFILASPRTGSTLVYQLIINFFNFFYFSNFVNDFCFESPVVGAALDLSIHSRRSVGYRSAYGKTRGLHGPSEASLVFKNWFGGQHPSQTRSCKVKAEKRQHFVLTMKSIHKMTGLPILAKNAWNCFRIQELTSLFQNTHFLWVRRDIIASANSDLEARYRRGDPTVWNSATTTNYLEIQKRPYWEQVVEQQYEYNRCMAHDLSTYSQGQFIELWYENVCERPELELKRLDDYFSNYSFPTKLRNRRIPTFNISSGPSGLENDCAKIVQYVEKNSERFREYFYDDSASRDS